MSFLTDDEQNKLNDEMEGPTTQKINKQLSASEERILKQLRPLAEKVEEHDGFIASFRDAWNRGIGAVTKVVKG
jgi:hypothetical protein